MSKQTSMRGHCLCGAVTLTCKDLHDEVGACHCSMCRHWCGGPYLEINCGTDVEIVGEEHIRVYSSSDWAERAFCSNCGSNLFYRLKESGICHVTAGIFDLPDTTQFKMQVFVDEKPDYYEFANETGTLTGEEVFKLFA